jgi:UDP-3-O-[3-hydroxymyristoyl] glucosamine N-acyltransferase
MKLHKTYQLTDIASLIDAQIIGDPEFPVTGINEIHKVTPGDVTFVDIEKYYKKALTSDASVVIIDKKTACPEGKHLLVVDKPFNAYNFLAKYFRPPYFNQNGQSANSSIHPSVIIENGAIIADHVEIGEGTVIKANAVIAPHVKIGKRVIIEQGTVIGSDAFYFKKENGKHTHWHSCGRVIIEDDVHIGAVCSIARGVSGDTIIREGSKLDCHIHIGHGVVIGKHCLIAALSGISGKTIVGDNVTIYGQVGIAQNLHIGDGVTIYAKSGVMEDLEAGKTYFGSPTSEAREKMKEYIMLKKLPEIWDKVKRMV